MQGLGPVMENLRGEESANRNGDLGFMDYSGFAARG